MRIRVGTHGQELEDAECEEVLMRLEAAHRVVLDLRCCAGPRVSILLARASRYASKIERVVVEDARLLEAIRTSYPALLAVWEPPTEAIRKTAGT